MRVAPKARPRCPSAPLRRVPAKPDESFGALRPGPFQRLIIALTRRLPPGWLFLRIGFLLRKLVMRSARRVFDAEVYGQAMRLHPHDNLCEKRVLFTPQLFDVVERETLAARMHGEFTFVDVGANVGVYSLFVAGKAGPGARIVAVEPDPEVFGRLKFNLTASGLGNVTPVARAIGTERGRATLFVDRANRGQNSLIANGGSGVEVSCTTLLGLLDDHRITTPDAMKMDIEGFEHDVLQDFFTTATPERFPRLLILENSHKEPLTEAVQLAISHGYRVLTRTRMNVILHR
ncbi:MAG: FkbM family methyltransferase [Candidatus Nealsonbacteria bacterium]|nr:FkbM family methyltransferase [Candidatus Nealsonbacteria bacterium]